VKCIHRINIGEYEIHRKENFAGFPAIEWRKKYSPEMELGWILAA
jgi:hypothetical protein